MVQGVITNMVQEVVIEYDAGGCHTLYKIMAGVMEIEIKEYRGKWMGEYQSGFQAGRPYLQAKTKVIFESFECYRLTLEDVNSRLSLGVLTPPPPHDRNKPFYDPDTLGTLPHYLEQHWIKAIDLKSAVERLYEKLSALEFGADHKAIYGMERYYTIQQCEELRDKYKFGGMCVESS
ncbi:hypothetical protein FQA39_LY08052 [Lamprigera yunnana]|nr:hypothetical protein FQA39_LY08052 [Lamprigera yunnana]